MRRTVACAVGAGLMLWSGSIYAGQAGRGTGGTCDRACLQGFVEQYLDAWVARHPTRLPLAPNVKYTKNGQRFEHRIEAVLTQSPYGQQSGWSTYAESMSDRARDIR